MKTKGTVVLMAVVMLVALVFAGCARGVPVPAGCRADWWAGRDKKTGLWKEVVHKQTGIHLRLIPAGEFDMGSPDKEKGRAADEGPVHHVKLSVPFYIGVTEVTQAQWRALMGSDEKSTAGGNSLPVAPVSYNEAQAFLAKAGGALRLPTEAEWEYACRAGNKGAWCFGDDETMLYQYGWYDGNSNKQLHPVGDRKRNAWGLYDMHGNAWEWCADWYDANYYATGAKGMTDPQGPKKALDRVLRGGSYNTDASMTRSASRMHNLPDNRYLGYGFRVAAFP